MSKQRNHAFNEYTQAAIDVTALKAKLKRAEHKKNEAAYQLGFVRGGEVEE